MKVLVLAPQPFYIDRGSPIDVDILLRALSARGERVHALVYPQGRQRRYRCIHVHRVSAPSWMHPQRPGFSFRKLLCDIRMFFRAWGLVRRVQPTVVHAGEEAVFMAMFFRVLYGIPYVYDMDSSIAQQLVEQCPLLRPLAPLFNAVEASAIRGAIAVAPVCNALADLARSRGAARVTTLHDISQLVENDFTPAEQESLHKRLQLRRRDVILMYVGNFEGYQGVDLLLHSFGVAISRGARVQLVLAGGSAPDIERYRSLALTLGVAHRTHFIGPWPVSRLGKLLAQADILAAPRMKGINTPMKVFPYLHSGRAVLATDLPTHTQILNSDVAMLAAPDPENFGAAILQLAGDHELRKRLGRAGRAFVERQHTFTAHQKRVGILYDSVERAIERPWSQSRATGAAINTAPSAAEKIA